MKKKREGEANKVKQEPASSEIKLEKPDQQKPQIRPVVLPTEKLVTNAAFSNENPDRSSSEFQSSSHKNTFANITKNRFKIKETNDLFDEKSPENDEEEDPLFKNTNKKMLSSLFKPVDFSPTDQKTEIVKESAEKDEESPKKLVFISRPSLRKKDFEYEEKSEAPMRNVNKNDKLKGIFMDSDEEKTEDLLTTYKLGDIQKNDGIMIRNLRKSYTIKQKDEEQVNKNQLDHEILLEKPILSKKKKNPSFFHEDNEEIEEKNLKFERTFNAIVKKTEEKEKIENNNEFLMRNKGKFEEEKVGGFNNSKKLEKLFDDEEDEDIFSKPQKFESGGKKKLFYEEEDDEN